MSLIGRGTDTAKIYREAGRVLADDNDYRVAGYSCLAVCVASDPKYTGNGTHYEEYETVRRYLSVFPEVAQICLEPMGDRHNIRLLALCFMAAMVEAGDA